MGSKPLVRPPRLARGSRDRAGGAGRTPAGTRRSNTRRGALPCAGLRTGPRRRTPAVTTATSPAPTTSGWPISTPRSAIPAIDAIWCIRGGYGVTRILDGVDFEALARRPAARHRLLRHHRPAGRRRPPRGHGRLPRARPLAPQMPRSAGATSRRCSPSPSRPGALEPLPDARRTCWCRRRTGSSPSAAAWPKGRSPAATSPCCSA